MGIIQELFGSQVLWIALWIILPAFLITIITDCNGRPAGQRQDLPNWNVEEDIEIGICRQ